MKGQLSGQPKELKEPIKHNIMIDRIFKSWKTSLVALVIAFVFVWQVVTTEVTLTEIGAFLGVIVTLLGWKEKGR